MLTLSLYKNAYTGSIDVLSFFFTMMIVNITLDEYLIIIKESLDFAETAPTKFGFLTLLHLCQKWR